MPRPIRTISLSCSSFFTSPAPGLSYWDYLDFVGAVAGVGGDDPGDRDLRVTQQGVRPPPLEAETPHTALSTGRRISSQWRPQAYPHH